MFSIFERWTSALRAYTETNKVGGAPGRMRTAAPILPHVYAYGSGTKDTIVSNISQDKHSRGEGGSVLVCSPRLSRFVTPLPRLDTERWLISWTKRMSKSFLRCRRI